MHIFLETLYFSINILLMFLLFIWPSAAEFKFKNFFLIFLFLLLSGGCFFWDRKLKKNPDYALLKNWKISPIFENYLTTMRIDFSGWFPLALFMFFMKPFLFDICVIPSGSMQPTFWEGDRVLLNRCVFGLRAPKKSSFRIRGRDPQKGEIVCFFPPNQTKEVYVKRVIGVGGDTVKLGAGNAVVVIPKGADEKDAKKYLLHTKPALKAIDPIETTAPNILALKEQNGDRFYFIQNKSTDLDDSYFKEEKFVVPEGHYFVMGDNRKDSSDSRTFHSVPRENIIATPILIVFSFQWMNGQSFPTIQWTRFFKLIR